MNNYRKMIKPGKKGSSITDKTAKIWIPSWGNFKRGRTHYKSFWGRLNFKEGTVSNKKYSVITV